MQSPSARGGQEQVHDGWSRGPLIRLLLPRQRPEQRAAADEALVLVRAPRVHPRSERGLSVRSVSSRYGVL